MTTAVSIRRASLTIVALCALVAPVVAGVRMPGDDDGAHAKPSKTESSASATVSMPVHAARVSIGPADESPSPAAYACPAASVCPSPWYW